MKSAIAASLILLLLGGCIHINLYDKQVSIPSQEWSYDFVPEYSFEITDTASHYYVYVVLRHTDQYQFNNIWLNIGTAAPGEPFRNHKINVSLAGKDSWDGSGMDDIYTVRKLIIPGAVPFEKPGVYKFSIAQIMRENPLKHILNVGIRIEKAE